MKRRLDDVERENAIFHHLVDSMRNAADAQLAEIVAFVRSRASLVEIELWLSRMVDEVSLNQQRCDDDDEQKELAARKHSLDNTDSNRVDSMSQDMSMDTSQ